MRSRFRAPILIACAIAVSAVAPALAQSADIPRTASGRPDLSGTYDIATLTPLQRPERFGDKAFLTEEEAAEIARQEFERNTSRNEASDPNREAPPAGGDGSPGAAGNVGGYNTFWIDRGNDAYQIDGQWRTSIIVDPPNGRQPPLTDAARARQAELAGFRRPNTGTAWWMIENGADAEDVEVAVPEHPADRRAQGLHGSNSSRNGTSEYVPSSRAELVQRSVAVGQGHVALHI